MPNLEKINNQISIILNKTFKPKELLQKLITQLLLREEKRFNIRLASKLLENENFLKSVIVISFEMVLFVENCSELNVCELIRILKLDLYEFWKIINPFNKCDAIIHGIIKNHFSTIETQIFTFLIWQKIPNIPNNFLTGIEAYFLKNRTDISNFKVTNFDEQKEIEDLEFNNQSLFVYQ